MKVDSVEDYEEYDKYDIVNPIPAALIESMRAFGYSPETSVADLMDNSISAGARNIWVKFVWLGSDSYVAIIDDGSGMNEAALVKSMRLGSQNPLDERDESDLGRFGLGLKTASLAQCRSLTVGSLGSDQVFSMRLWDLDYIANTGEWRLLKGETQSTAWSINQEIVSGYLTGLESGTVVIWNNLDRLLGDTAEDGKAAERAFYTTADRVKEHLQMVFHRYMTGRGKLNIYYGNNEAPLKPWDPFLSRERSTQMLEHESPVLYQRRIDVRPYILPHHTKIDPEVHDDAAGIKGWNAHQGFYVYRNKRLLVPGSWLGLSNMKQEEHYKLARIQIDIPNSMDDLWELDVKKSDARPPVGLQAELRRIATGARSKASEVYRYRGKSVARTQSGAFVYIWTKRSLRGGRFRWTINREHPLMKSVKDLLSKEGRQSFEATLKMIEETIPVAQLWVDTSETPDKHVQYFEEHPAAEVLEVMEAAFRALIVTGHSETEAVERLSVMEPFERYPEQLALLKEGIDRYDNE